MLTNKLGMKWYLKDFMTLALVLAFFILTNALEVTPHFLLCMGLVAGYVIGFLSPFEKARAEND